VSRADAIKLLIKIREVRTSMLSALGLDMEDFLRLAQLSDAQHEIIISKLINHYKEIL
jgi:hypothetical protein